MYKNEKFNRYFWYSVSSLSNYVNNMHYLEKDFNYHDLISFKTYRTLEELIPEEKKIYKEL